MRPDEERVAAVLSRYISPITAQGMARRACQAAGVLDTGSLGRVLAALEPGIRLFVEHGRRARLLDELRGLVGDRSALFARARSIAVATQSDASRARLAARDLCQQVGGRSLACHKVATAVSELARNQVQYAAGGRIELLAQESPLGMQVRAVDDGPGMADLAAVLEGRYRSSTGLGLGLLGVKRMAIRFEARTGPEGTVVEAEFTL